MYYIKAIAIVGLFLLTACNAVTDQNIKNQANMIELQKLFHASLFHHYDIEVGAPSLYDYSPFGGDETVFLYRVAEIVGRPKPASKQELKIIANLYIDYCLNLKRLISNADLALGTYKVPDIQKIIRKLADVDPKDTEQSLIELSNLIDGNFKDLELWEEFEVTQAHLNMLNALNWNIEYQGNRIFSLGFDEETAIREKMVSVLTEVLHDYFLNSENQGSRFNVPVVAGEVKRPYGDSTYYYWDLQDQGILSTVPDGALDERNQRKLFSDQQTQHIDRLQYEPSLTLQAIALYGEFN